MRKIFGIGLSRTGTSSLTVALEMLGYKAVHFPQSLGEIDACDAATDTSVAFIYKDLDRLYPGSKFILTVRPMQAWLASCAWHFRDPARLDGYGAHMRQLSVLIRTTLYDGVGFEAERFRRCYARYLEDVERHFAGRPGDLLTVDVCTAPRWDQLCEFLGKPTPIQRFPWLNRRDGPDELPATQPGAVVGTLRRILGAVRGQRPAARRDRG